MGWLPTLLWQLRLQEKHLEAFGEGKGVEMARFHLVEG